MFWCFGICFKNKIRADFVPNRLFIPSRLLLAGASETVVLNMSTLVWSVVITVQGRVPVASEVFCVSVDHHLCEGFLKTKS